MHEANDLRQTNSENSLIAQAAAIGFLHMLAGVAVLFVLLHVVPYYVDMFELWDFGLPILTMQLIEFARFTSNYWYLVVLFGFVFVGRHSATVIDPQSPKS